MCPQPFRAILAALRRHVTRKGRASNHADAAAVRLARRRERAARAAALRLLPAAAAAPRRPALPGVPGRAAVAARPALPALRAAGPVRDTLPDGRRRDRARLGAGGVRGPGAGGRPRPE